MLPAGNAEVEKVAVPVEAVPYGVLRVVEPSAVVVVPFSVEKATLPTPLEGVTVTENVTEVPSITVVDEGEIATELAVVRPAAQAVARLYASTEPRPVTTLYPLIGSELEALKPITPVVPDDPGQITSAGFPEGVSPWQ